MYDYKNFGQFVRTRRIEMKISLRKFADSISMSFSHWSDIETGKKNPPKDEVLDLISQRLNLSENDKNTMLTLVGLSRNSLAPDVIDYVMDNIYLNDILRIAKANDFKKKDWFEFLEFINIRKG